MSKNIKLCPFCGGDARLTYSTDNHRQPYVTCDTPRCPGCNTYQWHYHTEAEAIESWNRRVVTDTNDGSKERPAKVEDYGGCQRCSACANPVFEDDKFCSGCGSKLDWSDR